MDLISRQAVLDGIDKYIEKAQSTGTKDDFISFAELGVKGLPSAFEGMTYGEVMKTVLGIKDEQIEEAKYLICIYPKGNHHDPFMAVKREVWNSPYKEMSVIFGTVGASE